jgi:AraC family transcriptional regulator, chitin signaling transcriptional activator
MKNLEAEKKIIELQNEQLEKDMESKNKELAVSTMSLIKKNEFLSSIKEKLKDNLTALGKSPL